MSGASRRPRSVPRLNVPGVRLGAAPRCVLQATAVSARARREPSGALLAPRSCPEYSTRAQQVGAFSDPARNRRRRRHGALADERGFTLIELLVVVIILGLLAALVGPRLLGRVGQSKRAAAKVQIELIGAALDQFRLDIGRYPSTQEGLGALMTNPGNAAGWEGPYLKKELPRDPWTNVYQYKSPGDRGEYDLWSYGADQAPGGEGENADVVSWSTDGRPG